MLQSGLANRIVSQRQDLSSAKIILNYAAGLTINPRLTSPLGPNLLKSCELNRANSMEASFAMILPLAKISLLLLREVNQPTPIDRLKAAETADP
jgi:hypothetical protein